MIVVDTNILAELMKPRAPTAVVDWMRSQPLETLYTPL